MHADTLYHRMLAQERSVEEAKAAGQPIPSFPSMLSPDPTPLPNGEAVIAATTSDALYPKRASTELEDLPALSPETTQTLTPEAALALRKRMKSLDAVGRLAEERGMMAELRAAREVSTRIDKMNEERRNKVRAERGDVGQAEKGTWFEWLVRGPGK